VLLTVKTDGKYRYHSVLNGYEKVAGGWRQTDNL